MNGLKFLGFGHYAPKHVVTNDEISEGLETDDEWIRTRTGIVTRHFAEEGESNVTLATEAAKRAIENAGINKDDISYLIVTTFSSDFPVPSAACMVQDALGIGDTCTCLDVNAACSGFLYGLHTMRGFLIQQSKPGIGLIVGSEVISKRLDRQDRETCILFGDGAGAAVVTLDENYAYNFTSGSRGNYDVLNCDGKRVLMNGKQVFRFAVTTIPKCIDALLKDAGLEFSDIDYVVCHQANMRILEAVRTKYKAPEEMFPMNLQEYGNTSAASVPLLLSEMNEKGMFKKGQKIIAVGFGAGLTWAGALLEI